MAKNDKLMYSNIISEIKNKDGISNDSWGRNFPSFFHCISGQTKHTEIMKKVYVILILFLITHIFCYSQYDTLVVSNELKPKIAGLSIKISDLVLSGIALDIFLVPLINLEFYFLPKLITISSVGGGMSVYPFRRSEKTLLTPYLGIFYGGGVKEDITFFGFLLEKIEYKVLYFPIGVAIPNVTSINFTADIGFAYLSEFKNAQGLITEKESLKFNYSFKVGIRF